MEKKEKRWMWAIVIFGLVMLIVAAFLTLNFATKLNEADAAEVCASLTKAKNCLGMTQGSCSFEMVSNREYKSIIDRVHCFAASAEEVRIYKTRRHTAGDYVTFSGVQYLFLTSRFIETFRLTNEKYGCGLTMEESEIDQIKRNYARAFALKFIEGLRSLSNSNRLSPMNKVKAETDYNVPYLTKKANADAKEKFGYSLTEMLSAEEQAELTELDRSIRHQIATQAYKILTEECLLVPCVEEEPGDLASIVIANSPNIDTRMLFEIVRYVYALKAVFLLEKLEYPDEKAGSEWNWRYHYTLIEKKGLVEQIRDFAVLGQFDLEEIGTSDDQLDTLLQQTDTAERFRERILIPFPTDI